MTVLIATTSTTNDPGICSVSSAIEARGADAVRLDTDLFPSDIRLTLGWDKRERLWLSSSQRELDLSQVTAVWIRHMDTGAGLPDEIEQEHREASRLESDSMVWGLLECLRVFQLDPPESLRKAPFKPRQLQMARQLGLEIPRTLITNDPEQVRDFASSCPNGLIAKMVDGSSISVKLEDRSAPVYTRYLSPEDFEELESLTLCPMIFQESVAKAHELRITVVGREIFVAAVNSSTSSIGTDDWRKDSSLVQDFKRYDSLPEAVQSRLFSLLDKLGLNFATIDMIVTPEEKYVFLEFNTVSYFDFVEEATGLPISAAIADLLLGLAPSRV